MVTASVNSQVFNLAAAAAAAAGSSPSTSSPSSAAAKKSRPSVASVAEQDADPAEPPEDAEDNAPLFYSPGKRGFYSPIQGRRARFNTQSQLSAFRGSIQLDIENSTEYLLTFTQYCKTQ